MRAGAVGAVTVVIVGLSVVAPVSPGQGTEGSVRAAAEGETGHDSVIVFFDQDPSSTATLNAVTDETNLSFGRLIDADTRVYETSDLLSDAGVDRLADDLSTLGNVVDVVPNAPVRRIDTAVSDPFYLLGQQKALTGPRGINPVPAWALTRGAGATVAVLDTGIVAGHPDLQGNIVGGYDFVSEDGPGNFYTAHDGDGWDADPSDPGDWCDRDANGVTRPNGEYDPSSWHGTHVAGTIAALQNNIDPGTGNYVGISGVAPMAKVMPIRVLGRCEGHLDDLIAAMKWAVGLPVLGVKRIERPARILNLSLGSETSCDGELASLIGDIADRALIVTAAGNSNADVVGDMTRSIPPTFPANCSRSLTVAATDDAGLRASFSNYGSLVDVSAPGVGVISTWNDGLQGPGNPAYASGDGTSMAAPHVAGVAALMLAVNPALTLEQMTAILTAQVTASPAYPGTPPSPGSPSYPSCDVARTCGSGIVNAGSAVTASVPNAPPSEPLGVSASRSGRNVTVSWQAPQDPGTSPVSSYTVRANGSDACTTASGAELSCTMPNMASGTYTFTVQATNAAGRGPASSSSATLTVEPDVAAISPSTVPALTATTTTPKLVRTITRGSRTSFSRIYVAPRGARTKWSVRGQCSIRSSRVVALQRRGTCTVTVRQTLKGRTTTKVISLRVT